MKTSPAERADVHISAQVAVVWAHLDAASRADALAGAPQGQARAFAAAMREMQNVRDFVGAPENILGSTETKHGEIAERVHVGVTRARDVLHGRAPTATFNGATSTGWRRTPSTSRRTAICCAPASGWRRPSACPMR